MSFSLESLAKINWSLQVLGRRDDGFHDICTIFQTVSFGDSLRFEERDGVTGVQLTSDDSAIPTDGRNLIVQAGEKLLEAAGSEKSAAIHLNKRIPSPGGLGGGSSNAAAALIGLNRLWDLSFSIDELKRIGSDIGSDVPFFFEGGTVIGTGRGEILESRDDVVEELMLIVTPEISVATGEAFVALNAPALTIPGSESILTVCRNEARSLDPRRSELINDFEPSVFSAYPEVARVKSTLIELGAVNAAMSGSGASVFAIFDKQETRQTALKALDHESTWRKFAVSTVSRDEYRESLGI